MKKFLVIIIVLACIVGVASALTYDQDNYVKNRTSIMSGTGNDPLYNFIGEVDDIFTGADTTGITNLLFASETSAPTATEGRLYYNSALEKMVLRTATGWDSLESGGSYASLDEAYNGGESIVVDSGTAVTLTTGASSDSEALSLVHGETGAYPALLVANAGTDPAIEIATTGTGADITGTSATWSVSKLGVATTVGVIVGASDIVMENGEIINNVDDDVIEFDGTEDFEFNLATSNTLTLASDTDIDTIAFGLVDALTGVGSIAFDDAASTITLTSTGATDLTIAQATTDQDASLILTSSGVGTDALSLSTSGAAGDIKIASVDNIDIDAADDITINTAGGSITTTLVTGDFSVDATDSSITLDSGEAATDAINIDAAAGGIDADVALSISLKSTENTADAIELVATAGGIDITAAGAAGEDIDIANAAGSVNISAGEDSAAAIYIEADAGTSEKITIHSDQGTDDESIILSSDVGGITLNAAAGSVDIEAVGATAGDIGINAGDDVTITAAGVVTIANTGTMTVNGAETVTGKLTVSSAIVTPVEVVTSTNAITIAEAGKVFVLNSATEFASTLPSAATSAGITYRFIIGAAPAGANYTIVTDSSENLIYGMVLEAETDTSDDGPVAQEEDTITFVQSIAVIGDWVEVTCDGTNWYISGMTAADGAVTLTQAS